MRPLLAEAIGTFVLVFAGTAAIIVNDLHDGVLSHLGIALVFGFAVLTVIYSIGEVSGAHINPAVTIAFWVSGRFPRSSVLPYIASQCLGALLASTLLSALFPTHQLLGSTLPQIGVWQTLLLEFILTWWLMFVILGVSEGAKEKGIIAGIVIGTTVALEAAFAGPLTGASMNPARSLGPALVSGHMGTLWLYIVSPVAGAISAVFCCRIIRGEKCCSKTGSVNEFNPNTQAQVR